jgi:hypothetical protein
MKILLGCAAAASVYLGRHWIKAVLSAAFDKVSYEMVEAGSSDQVASDNPPPPFWTNVVKIHDELAGGTR